MHNLLYGMKREWGRKVNLIQIIGIRSDNDETGEQTVDRKVYNLTAVVLPLEQTRKFIQDIGYLAADKNFTYGALNDFNNISMLIERREFPRSFEADLNGYIVYNHKRYELVGFKLLAEEVYVFVAKGVESSSPAGVICASACNSLQMQGSTSAELN